MYLTLRDFIVGRELHPDVLWVLNNLSQRYGERLVFLSRETEWINFEVRGLTDEYVIRELEKEQKTLFGDMTRFQVVRGLELSERGIFLRYLENWALRIPGETGFWYY